MTTPLLSVESFRRAMSYNPWHWWGMSGTLGRTVVSSSCNDVVRQYAWQNADATGRSEIAEAIDQAVALLTRELGYRPAPAYVEREVSWPRFHNSELWRRGTWGSDGRRISVQLDEGYIQAVGVEAHSLISAGVTVTYSDPDGDTINELATFSVATSVTDVAELAVYFPVGVRANGPYPSAIAEDWRIAPLDISISGGVASFRGPAWLFVKPVLYEGVAVEDLSIATATFATTVDIYRRYTDTEGQTNATAQALLVWETRPCAGWWCGCSDATYSPVDSAADPAARGLAIARVGIRDARMGIVTPAQSLYNSTSGIWSDEGWATGYEPDRVVVRYLAGLPLENGQMQRELQTVVARLAAAELARPICACDNANRELYRWQFDHARAAGANDEQYDISPEDLNNPLGTRAGHIQAWKYVRLKKQTRGHRP